MIAAALGIALCAAAAGAQDQPPTAITRHHAELPGGGIDYTAEAGRTAIRDVATGATLGHTFYLAYAIAPARDAVRPITFIWNGGPGLPAASLNFEGAGPRRIVDGRLIDNADTWLTDSDLVFVDPVGTGFSRPVSAEALPAFTSVVGDVAAVTEFIRAWLIQHRAQHRPLIVAGQSYGAGRAGSVAYRLLERGFDVRGLALISNTQGLPDYPDQALIAPAMHVADYAVTALYYHKLPAEYGTTPAAARAEAERWARETYLPALRRIATMPIAERDALRRELARRIGLAPDKIDRDTVSLTQGTFLGGIAPSMPYYLDYRFLEPYHYPPLDAGVASIRDDLGYNSDLPYLGVEPIESGFAPTGTYPPSINSSWLHSTVYDATPAQIEQAKKAFAATGRIGMYRYGPPLPGAAEAFALNPNLHILVAHGAYDPVGGCSIDAEHGRHLPPAYVGKIAFRCYLSGHAIYRDAGPRAQFADDMRALARDVLDAPAFRP
ncbi:carboxypeptidase C (cathepsin A) [Hephaestia caeni]|uniref:Carboxypeptidase C (Cathepsin A) n=2 Tax=Hephaestia caeni TaxID=645617 RepID=A0A397NK57_9SPHN|nr:carboxypeptidase C (cathepsin A) [Hephaestia caeni]